MDVAVLYSGGKDSTLAIEYALNKGYNIKYLLSVKPTRTDCFLFHYATVEHTKELAKILGLKHILISCNVADPTKEANLIKEVVLKEDKIDALILGGIGLQLTQIGSLQKALLPLGIEVFASHAGLDHDKIMEDMTKVGYTFMITQVASDGLMKWLGKIVNKDNLQELFEDARKFRFHPGFEGGYADSLILSGPIFNGKELNIQKLRKVVDNEYCGHIIIDKLDVVKKPISQKLII